MPRKRIDFPGHGGDKLTGLLEFPNEEPRAFALFAHCFTCSKDIAAASRVTRALSARGIAALRFDFTGLGNSDGDFANTNFMSNLEDLIAAADFLAAHYRAPQLLIGHSLGGAAVLAAASRLEHVGAVVTIGAPATASHLEHLIDKHWDDINAQDEALIELGGRNFTIKNQFLDDIDRHNDTDHIGRLDKALLIMHSPVDTIVSIDEAAKIYAAARHPKSFVSLDEADHLLSRAEDSNYAAEVIASWAARYLVQERAPSEQRPSLEPGTVVIGERDRKFLRSIYTSSHEMTADEPLEVGGGDAGPNPYEFLLAALDTCTSMTIHMYANRKSWPLDEVIVTLKHRREHCADSEDCESPQGYVDLIERRIELRGELDTAVRQRLLEIADRCPVHKTLENEIVIRTELAQ